MVGRGGLRNVLEVLGIERVDLYPVRRDLHELRGHQPYAAFAEFDLEIAHQLFRHIDPKVRDAADDKLVGRDDRQASAVAPADDAEILEKVARDLGFQSLKEVKESEDKAKQEEFKATVQKLVQSWADEDGEESEGENLVVPEIGLEELVDLD